MSHSQETEQLAKHVQESNLYLQQLQERYQSAYLQIMELILSQVKIPQEQAMLEKSDTSSENRLQQALITQLLIEDSVLQ